MGSECGQFLGLREGGLFASSISEPHGSGFLDASSGESVMEMYGFEGMMPGSRITVDKG